MRTKTIILAALFSLIPAVPVMAADAQTAPAPKDGAATAPAADGHAHRGFRHFIAGRTHEAQAVPDLKTFVAAFFQKIG